MKKYIVLLICVINCWFSCAFELPLIIQNQEFVFNTLSRDISIKLPKKIEILVFNLSLLNGNEQLDKKLNENFQIFMKTKQYVYKYTLVFFEDIRNDDDLKKYNFIQNYDEQELSSFAKYINKDAILMASVTLMKDSNRKIWDNSKSKFVKKEIALMQGNIFNVETRESMLRFSYYFYID